ncbi:hypothetical protein LZ578_12100 (plasmid) [Jeotgalibaca sp. MA1X17-3]|uniref:hypothetical protein n=1 Tax=Jeotgalibaca sp. MA1X17-3 TaxID=2908211 RepID=UPI001F37B24C|nr:hypothetical protein [Jeotgalibaca sp. MA1X17-3]UJF16802.1 hypothetical protein LZ578_12100 [Jeotgalibaca sp. MA1X17-3]
MKKIILSVLSLIVLITLSGCQDKFDPQTAIQDSRTTLNEFLGTFDKKEKVLETYTEKEVTNFFEKEQQKYFSENFKQNILPYKLEELEFDIEKDYLKIGKHFLFLAVTNDENGVFWNKMIIKDDELDTEKETVTFYISSESPSRPSGYIEMIKENGTWKINNILEL